MSTYPTRISYGLNKDILPLAVEFGRYARVRRRSPPSGFTPFRSHHGQGREALAAAEIDFDRQHKIVAMRSVLKKNATKSQLTKRRLVFIGAHVLERTRFGPNEGCGCVDRGAFHRRTSKGNRMVNLNEHTA
jgi:hypothetical protein